MIIALVGNPNCGKTTLFNELTKLNQKIGNWPGVTIEKKEGKFFKDKNISIIDLPGIYSLRPITPEEKITCGYLKNSAIDVIVNVVDSTNLERNLALSLQLLETGIPMVLSLNMEDELKINGLTLNTDFIKKELNVEAVLISAVKNKNLAALVEKAKDAALAGKRTAHFVSIGKTEEEKAEYRHNYIKDKIDLFRVKSVSKSKRITDAIDRIILNKWLAYPIFALVIWLMYFISVQTVGALSAKGMNWIFKDLIGENLRGFMTDSGAAPWAIGLIVDAIIGGAGAVLSFIPQIIMLFLFITFLEHCGYMARVALIMDRIFRKIGLSGKSFIPMIIGCGCSVPAIMSSKTIEGEAERKTTIMLTPFVPCSAKLPVFALIAGALFPNNSLVAPSMYFLGIFVIILSGLILKMFRKSAADTFIMELAPYRLPKAKNILKELWDKAKGFIIRAGAVIVPATIILWFLQSFNFSFQMTDIEGSILASIGRIIAPIFIPLGFGKWQSSIAVLTGFAAKETIVATFGVLLSSSPSLSAGLTELFTPQAAYAFMAFVLLSPPCIAAIAATKKEIGGKKWMFITIGFQFVVGYIVALIINQLGNAWMYNKPLFTTILCVLPVAVIFALCIKYLFKNKGKPCGNCNNCAKKSNCAKDEKIDN